MQHGFGLVASALRDVLSDSSYRERARNFAQYLSGWNSAELVADAIEERLTPR